VCLVAATSASRGRQPPQKVGPESTILGAAVCWGTSASRSVERERGERPLYACSLAICFRSPSEERSNFTNLCSPVCCAHVVQAYPTLPYPYPYPYPTLPYPTLPLPTLPYPTLPTLPYYLPYPTLPYPTLPTLHYPTLPYPTLRGTLPPYPLLSLDKTQRWLGRTGEYGGCFRRTFSRSLAGRKVFASLPIRCPSFPKKTCNVGKG
jgi:hypothetical protein